MPRKTKELPPAAAAPVRKRDDKSLLHDNQNACGMPPPNHMMPADENTVEFCQRLGLMPLQRWPLTTATHRGENELSPTFVHPRHGVTHWVEWANQPPTWMDPHLLVDLALQDATMRKLLQTAYKQNDVKAYKAVQARLQTIFEEQYLVWIIEEFPKHAANTIARWLTNRSVQQQLDTPRRKKRRKP